MHQGFFSVGELFIASAIGQGKIYLSIPILRRARQPCITLKFNPACEQKKKIVKRWTCLFRKRFRHPAEY